MAARAEALYLKSPVWLQQSAVAAYGYWWYKRRFSGHFRRLVQAFQDRERWTSEQFRRYQEDQLGAVLSTARQSPYYRRLFFDAGVNCQMKPFDALSRLPLLSKDVLRQHARELLTRTPVPRNTLVFKSSGTTGTPTEIFYTPEFHALELAVPEARNVRWAGVTYRQRRVMFGVRKVCNFQQSKPPFWRFNPAENMAYASIYHLAPKFLPHYIRFLRNYKPAMIMGYPSALNTIAAYALENNCMPAPVHAVFTTSETLVAAARQRIERAFQCKIYDRYCAVEMCLFGSECEYGRYHVSPEVGIIELLDADGNPSSPGEFGEVVCTGLQNFLQPLIRYRIGDVARWSVNQDCSCGRAMPIIEEVEGRFEDICYTSDGRELLRFDTVFKGVDRIREAQVIQNKIDQFTIRVVPAENFGLDEIERIQHNMENHVGRVKIAVETVMAIERTPAGKFRAVICNLSPQEKKRWHRASIAAY
jgi:phenylacetate-CoA ligase